jgi:hypothetical protein
MRVYVTFGSTAPPHRRLQPAGTACATAHEDAPAGGLVVSDYVSPRWPVAAVVAAMLMGVLCPALALCAAAWHLVRRLRQVSR